MRRYNERPPDLQPVIDAADALLLAIFLRRYVTYCARRGRYAQMQGAIQLHREITAAPYQATSERHG